MPSSGQPPHWRRDEQPKATNRGEPRQQAKSQIIRRNEIANRRKYKNAK